MISSMGILSATGGNPAQVDSDMNISHTFNISCVNSSCLTCSTLNCTNYSIFGGWKKPNKRCIKH